MSNMTFGKGDVLVDFSHAPDDYDGIAIAMVSMLNGYGYGQEIKDMLEDGYFNIFWDAVDEMIDEGIYSFSPTVILRYMLNSVAMGQCIIADIDAMLWSKGYEMKEHDVHEGVYVIVEED